MTEDSSSHRLTKRIHVYSETSRRADLELVCIFGHDDQDPATSLKRFQWIGSGRGFIISAVR